MCLAWLSSALALRGLTPQPGPGPMLSLALLHSLDWDQCSDRLGSAQARIGFTPQPRLGPVLRSAQLGLG